MQNFEFQNPTKLVFGRGTITRLSDLIPLDCKVMVTFGGGSVKKNKVYNQVTAALKNHETIEFWGIESNPTVETISEAIALGLKETIGFLLAVGGGSVSDATKLIAAGMAMPQEDPWSIVLKKQAEHQIPYAVVMTMPATGSEMNNGAVISKAATREKLCFSGAYPQFAILDPEVTYSIPPYHIACGLADTMIHCFEQYMTTPGQSRVLDRWAEGIIATVMEIAPQIQKNQCDYDLMSDYMFSATMGLNNFIRMGVTGDWFTHNIGEQITALHGITHGETLTMIYPGTIEYLREQKKGKLLQFGERVLKITEGSDNERIDAVIAKIEAFFKSLGLATRLSEKQIGLETIEEITRRLNARGIKFGEKKNLTGDDARQIMLLRL